MGNGSFDHEADTREAAFALILPRLEEVVACSILNERALFSKSYFAESSYTDVQPSLFPALECGASLRTIFRVLHGVTVPAYCFEACCFLLSSVFLNA